ARLLPAGSAVSPSNLLASPGRVLGDASRAPHHVPRAKRIVQLFMAGAPSSLDLFDDKALLRKFDGKPVPDELLKGQRFAFLKGIPKLLGSPYSFRRYGDSAAE